MNNTVEGIVQRTSSVVEVKGLNVDLADHRVLENVTMSAKRGELICLLGPNGAGKTTLLRAVLHLIVPSSGSTTVDGDTSVTARRRIGYVPQRHQFSWDFLISVLDAVVLGRVKDIGWLRRPGKNDYLAALEALNRTQMVHPKDRPVGDLSGGQRQHALVARALALRPKVLLLDEPLTGLDMPTQELLTGLFVSLAGGDTDYEYP